MSSILSKYKKSGPTVAVPSPASSSPAPMELKSTEAETPRLPDLSPKSKKFVNNLMESGFPVKETISNVKPTVLPGEVPATPKAKIATKQPLKVETKADKTNLPEP